MSFSFVNMQSEFWTGYSLGQDDAVSYAFGYGNVPRRKTIVLGPGNEPPRRLGAWAVRDVTVVPEPVSSILFISGGAVAGIWRRSRMRFR